MAISGGPDIVEDGLVLHLDAAEPLCFRGEPTTNLMPYSNGVAGRVNWPNGAYTHSIETTGEFAGWEKIVATTTGSTPDTVMRVGDVSCLANTQYTATMEFYSPYNTLKFNVGGSYGNWNGIRIGNSNRYYVTFTKNSTTGNQGWWLKTTSYTPANTAITNGVIYYRRAQFEQRGYYTNFVEGTRGSTVVTGGGLLDLTNNGNNGEINRTSVPSAAFYSGNNGGSFVFDGSNDHIGIPYSSNLWFGNANWTIDCWINPNNFTDYGIIWDHGYGTPNTLRSIVIYINQTDGLIKIAQSPNGSTNYDVSLGLTLSTNTWQHLAIVRNNNNIVGYLNGVVGNTSIPAYSLYNSTTRSHFVGIQGDFQSVTAYDGLISNLHVYKNKGLTASEIQQNYNALKGRYGL